MDEDEPKRPKTHEVGMLIDTMSVGELAERIALLEGEIERLRTAMQARERSRRAAEAVFKL